MERNNSGSFQGGGRFSPLAIVGIGCRFPGGANDVETFWGMLEAGRSGIRETPEDRWDKGRYYNSDPSIPGVVISKWGGFVDNIDKFDARFWGLSPREAMRMDPQQRLLLEVAWEALEDAGTPPETIRGSRTGVFVGIASNDYSWLQMPYHEEVDAYTNSGNTGSIASNRISYLLDLKGPSSSVDTACSSALVAVWAACHSIWSGNCEAAIAGGVNVLLVPHASIGFSRASMLSPSGQCFAFDARANGYVRAEGAGAVFVKPLDRALADGDHIYATIRSAVCNQDGHTSSMTVPGVEGQSAMLRQAYAEAGVTPGRVVYMEAHGTGTPVGDPIEARALGNVLREGRPRGSKCLIGSVKTNIGHLEAGSGLPGLIKAALVLHKRVVPPSRNFEQPNPNIPFAELGLKVADQLQPLPVEPGQLPLAGVNSFGFGGTNAHVVLEAAPAVISPSVAPAERADRPYLLTVSARDDVALRESVERFRSFLDVQAPVLDAFCYSAGARREAHPQRLAFVGRTADELSESMRRWLQDPAQADSVVAGRVRGEAPPVVFVFTGQGAQWWGMGRELLVREPVFRRTLEQIDSLFQPLAGWSIIQELTRGEQDSRIDHTNIAQPAIFGLQVALAELWKSWGIQPSRVIGHSVGEVAAAYCAGIYTLNDAVRVIYHRSRLQNMTGGHGRMVAVGITAAEARQRIGAEGERVHIAVFNSPNLVTLAGDTEPLEGIVAQLEAEGKFVRWLRINYAFHTHQMEPICEELLGVLADIQPRPSQIPYVSTVTAGELAGEQLDALYWWRNVRQPVLFGPAIANMLQGEDVTFLELGPHPALASSLNEYVAAQGRSGRVFHSLKRHTDESREMLVNAARLHVSGTRLDWCAICQNDGQWLRLPPYPWNRERYWLESKDSWRDRAAPLDHPLLGLRVSAPLPTWRLKLHPGRLPYLRDHRFWDSIVFPGAGYAEMGIALARLLFPDEPHVVEDLEIKKAMFIGDEQLVQVQVVFDPSEKSFSVYSQVADKDEWDLHAQGKLTRVPAAVSATTDLAALQARLPDHFDHDRYYGEFAAAGYQFGPNFQHLQHVWRQQGEALAEIVVPEEVAETVDQYHFHPAVLDACFHIFKGVQVVPADAVPTDYFYLPHSIRRVRLYVDKPPTHLWAHAYLTQDDGHSLVSDIAVYDSQGRLVADILGFRADHVEQKRSADDVEQSCYQFRWEPRRLKGLGIEKPFSFASNAEVVADVRARTPEVRRARGLDSYTGQFIPRIEAIAGQYTQNAWLDLGWDPAVGEQCHLADLLVQLHILDTYERLARSHLTALAQHGILRSVGPDAWEVVRRLERRDPAPELEQLRSEFPRFATEADLHARTGPELAAVMTGATDPVRLLFPDGSGELLKHFYQEGMDFPALYDLMTAAVQRAIQGRSPRRALRVLEVGAGTGALTHALLPAFPPDVTEYRFTDVSPVLVSAAKGQLEGFPFVEFQSWDLEKEPASQSVPVQGFDLILASDVLHATADLRETLKHLRQCLAVGGRLMFLELTSRRPAWNNIFGLLSGWWRFQDDLRKDAPILSREQWHALLAECGFEDVTSFATACGSEHVEQEVFLASVGATPAAAGPAGAPTGASALGEAARVASSEPAPAGRGGFVLLADQGGRMQALAERLRARGYEAGCVAAADDYRQVDERT
ncbi:MAG: beta-ketoacyl synthase N-terminal-like domain-containing protein, partial [Pirellulaceae bacterium]